jgi:hypothetical protein
MYQVESADYGDLGAVSGSDLMLKGIEIAMGDVTRSHVLIFHAQPARRAAGETLKNRYATTFSLL